MWSLCKRGPQVALSLHPSLCGLASKFNLRLHISSCCLKSEGSRTLHSLFCKMHNYRSPLFGYNMSLAHISYSALCCCSVSLKWKSYNDVFLVCSLPHAHGGATLCCCWGLSGPESADRWPLSAWEVCAGDLLRVVMSDTRRLFAISLGYSFSQTHWVVGFSSSHWSACQLEDECPHSGCRMSWTRCG